MKKSSRINASEHHIIKQKQRSCHDSWSKPRQQFLGHTESYSWDSLREVLWDVCSLVWFQACRHRHDSSGGLQVVTSMLKASTIWYFNASGSEDLATLPGIQDRHNNVVPDESSSKQNLGQNFIAIFGFLCQIVSVCQLPCSALFSFMDSICRETCRILVDWSRGNLRECHIASNTIRITR